MKFFLQIRRGNQLGGYLLLAMALSAFAFSDAGNASSTDAKKSSRTSTASSTKSKRPSSKTSRSKTARGKKSAKKRGQQAIDSSRTREIQAALIREHYLTGEPSGTWDSSSQTAMQRYQADHGWQSKTTPDSRALIQLGLGPNPDHLLNPESAMTTSPVEPKVDSKTATKQPPQENMSKQ